MGKFEGPFGMPTPERVFEEYNERQRKNNIESENLSLNISFNLSNHNNYDEEYIYYENYLDEITDDLKYQIYSLEYENKKLKEKIHELEQILLKDKE